MFAMCIANIYIMVEFKQYYTKAAMLLLVQWTWMVAKFPIMLTICNIFIYLNRPETYDKTTYKTMVRKVITQTEVLVDCFSDLYYMYILLCGI